MPSFEEQVGGFLSHMGDVESAHRAARIGQQAQYRRKLANFRQLGVDASEYLRNNGVRPLPLLRYPNKLSSDTATNYRTAFVSTRAWYMGTLSLTQEGVFVSGHKPSQSNGKYADAELRRIGIKTGDWFMPHENPIEVSEGGPAQHPLRDQASQPDEFEIYVHSHEDEMTVGKLVAASTAILVSGGPDYNAVTHQRLLAYE